MDRGHILNSDSLSSFNRWHWIITLILLLLLLLLPWIAGIGPNTWRTCCPAPPVAAAPAVVSPAPAPVVPAPAPAAPVVEALPVARVYFDLDRFELPANVNTTLAEVIAYLQANPRAQALVSGFHDPRGTVARNEELALNRARAVRGALEAAGIVRERIVMNKPQVTTGTGTNDEARRVEVTIDRQP